MPPCPYCKKPYAPGKGMETHLGKCPELKKLEELAQANARAEEERDAVERAAAAERAMAEEREAHERAIEEAANLIRPPTPPPQMRPNDGRPVRRRKLPARFIHPEDDLPEPPLPAPPPPSRPPTPDTADDIPRRWVKTTPNRFGVYKVYLRQPTHDPDKTITLANLCATQEFAEAAPTDDQDWYQPFENPSQAQFMRYHHLTPNKESVAASNALLNEFFGGPDAINMDELAAKGNRPAFSVERGNSILDKFADTPPGQPPNGWRTGSVTLDVASTKIGTGPNAKPVMQYTIGGILYRPLMDIVQEAFQTSAFERMHTTPFSLRWDPKYSAARAVPATVDDELDEFGLPPLPRGHQELYGEMYSAQRTFEAFSKLPPCEEEPVIASIMPYSDATHLANFGTASLWPLYIYFGNRSKYERAKPSANAGYHAAYFPSVPEDIKDKYKEHYGHAMPDNVMTHTKRELFHAVWGLLIDDDFVDAWMNGRALECWDKIMRRLFPRIPTYGLDYPEKVLAATIRFLARYPCPRCFILKTDIPLTGTKHDLLRRQEHREDTTQRRWRVNNAHEAIFTNGAAVDGDVVDRMLGEKSWAAIRHAFTKLAEAGADFNLFQILVVDLLHEIELGIIKVILIHLIRLLYAMNKDKIAEFNARFRRVPTFGRMTIRRFHRSVSEMKKMAARDFEDILQCLLPVAEGLFEEHDALIQRLIFRLAHWHAYAKLRLHTTATLERFHDATEKLCTTIRQFARDTEHIKTHELPREQAARGRRTAAQAAKKASAPAAPDVPEPLDTEPVSTTRREKPLNLQTYKYHSIPDYPISIPLVGTTDSTSTQIGELAHRGVKRLYARTNRRNFVKQIAVNERRIRLMRGIFDRKHQLAVQAQKRAGANGHAVEEPPAKKLKHSWRSRLRYALNGKPGLTPYTPAGAHHHISESTRTFWQIDDLPGTTHLDDDDEGDDDPALKNFMLKLRSHIRRRLEGLDDDDDVEYTPEKLLEVDFLKDRLYTHATMRVNYTTYDLQRDQDCISPRRRPDVMVLSHDPNDKHPYWYCRVLGVYHVWVRIPGLASYRKIEFLWVRWFRRDMTYRCIPDMARMPRMEFMHYEDEEAFGFLDPDHLIRGAHIIPAFHYGQTTELLPKSIVRQESEEDQDWAYYYANGVVDRDMFMRYQRDAVGHRHVWKDATYSLGADEDEDSMDVDSDTEEAAKQRARTGNDEEEEDDAEVDEFWDSGGEDEEEGGEAEADQQLIGDEALMDRAGYAP